MSRVAVNNRRDYRRILIIKPSSLGDIVHALPVLAGLRAAYPRAHIAWLVGSTFLPLIEGHPLLDEVIPFDRGRYGRMLKDPGALLAFLRFLGDLRRRRFDLAVDLQGLGRSGFLAWAGGAAERVGFSDARELAGLFYTRRVRRPPGAEHAVDKNLAVLAALGLPAGPAQFDLAVKREEHQAARLLLARAMGHVPGAFTAVVPAARWESKLWPPARWAELIDRLHTDGRGPCVLLGSPADRELAHQVRAASRTEVISLVGDTTLRELVALLDLADLVICHDSGPMHIAAALKKPLVALFGPTNPRRTGPYGSSARIIAQPLPCVPCYRRRCPLGHHACLAELPVARVLDEVRRLRPAPVSAIP
jgi:lipopolysaccharide heptosyltransferase I